MLSILSCGHVGSLCLSFVKGCEENWPLKLGFWKSVVFGIHFCNTFPGPFLRAAVINCLLNWRCQSALGEGNGNPLQYSCLESPMDGGACWATVYGVAKSRTRLSDFTFTFHFHALEKEMVTPSNVLAWRIPGKGEPGGLPSQGSHRVGHDWSDLAAAAAAAADVSE